MARNFLWFAEADVEEAGDALMVAADSYLGCDTASGGVVFYFKDLQGAQARESVTLSCTNGNQKAVMEAMARIMRTHPRGGASMIVVADYNVANSQTAIGAHKEFGGLVTGVTIA